MPRFGNEKSTTKILRKPIMLEYNDIFFKLKQCHAQTYVVHTHL
jgi:hypothetical protein